MKVYDIQKEIEMKNMNTRILHQMARERSSVRIKDKFFDPDKWLSPNGKVVGVVGGYKGDVPNSVYVQLTGFVDAVEIPVEFLERV